jgi:hypothetical protein
MRALLTDDLSPACLDLLRDAGVEPVVRVGG